MLIYHDPKRWRTVSRTTVCPFHRANPGKVHAGCTCSGTIYQERVSDEEYERRRVEEIREYEDGILRQAKAIEARRATTTEIGVVHESGGPEGICPDPVSIPQQHQER